MSFWTNYTCCRPGPPPSITGDDLSRFVLALDTLVSTDNGNGLFVAQVSYDEAIDQDRRDTEWEEADPDDPTGIACYELVWDVELDQARSRAELAAALAGDERHVYRAFLMLGEAAPEAELAPLRRPATDDSDRGLYPCELSLTVGPLRTRRFDEGPLFSGWLGLSIGGYGYLHPWKLNEVIERLETTPVTQELRRVCREFWPVDPRQPSWVTVARRRRLPQLWGYPDAQRPDDWHWMVDESG